MFNSFLFLVAGLCFFIFCLLFGRLKEKNSTVFLQSFSQSLNYVPSFSPQSVVNFLTSEQRFFWELVFSPRILKFQSMCDQSLKTAANFLLPEDFISFFGLVYRECKSALTTIALWVRNRFGNVSRFPLF